MEHVRYGSGDEGEGPPACEVFFGTVNGGAAGRDIEAADGDFEPWTMLLSNLYTQEGVLQLLKIPYLSKYNLHVSKKDPQFIEAQGSSPFFAFS